MPLQKGFLRPQITLEVLNLNHKKLVFGILSWLVLSFSIYSILYILRESFRYTSFWWNREDFMMLTPGENYFYNFFFAFLACTFAFTAISNQWIRRSSTLLNIPRYKKAAIFHDKVSFTWYFVFWFSKMGIFFGVVSCWMGVFSKFSLYPSYCLVLGLILLNLFLHQWLTLRLLFKNSILPWMVATFGAVTFVSLIFACVNFIHANSSISKSTIGYYLSLELPILKNGKEISNRQYFKVNIYVGFPRHNSDSIPQIMVRDFHDPINNISIGMLEEFVKKERAKLDEYSQDEIFWRLNIDKKVKMKYVRALKNQLSRINARRVQYVGCNSQCNGFTDIVGLRQYLQRFKVAYPQFSDSHTEEVTLPIKIRDNEIWFKDSVITLTELGKISRDFILANRDNGILEYDVDNESTFGVYISVYDQSVGIIMDLRDEWVMKNYQMHYSVVESYDSVQQHIDYLAMEQFPLRFFEKD